MDPGSAAHHAASAARCAASGARTSLRVTVHKERSMPTIYYIRHGETEWNAEGKLQGNQDIPLNDLGRKQAAHAGKILTDLFARDGRDKSSLAFVASPLGRARLTMELIRA